MRNFPAPFVNRLDVNRLVRPGDEVTWWDHVYRDEDGKIFYAEGALLGNYTGIVEEAHVDHAIVRWTGFQKDDKPVEFEEEIVRVDDPRKVYWFTKEPDEIAAMMGLEIHSGKLRDLVDFAENPIGLWETLSMSSQDTVDEFVNFLLGPIAVALNENGLGFKDRFSVLDKTGFVLWEEAIGLGLIPKSIRKEFDVALIKRFNSEVMVFNAKMEAAARALLPDEDPVLVRVALYEWMSPARYVFYDILAEFVEPLLSAPSSNEIGVLVDKVMADNPDQADKARHDPKLVGWLMGQVMKASSTKLDANEVRSIILGKL